MASASAAFPVHSVLGTCDDVSSCDCCGRQNLKRTVALHNSVTGEDVFFGTTCAARALKWTTKEVRSAVKDADARRAAEERAAREAKRRAEDALWQSFLDANAVNVPPGHHNRFLQIESLGGYAAARDLFKQGRVA